MSFDENNQKNMPVKTARKPVAKKIVTRAEVEDHLMKVRDLCGQSVAMGILRKHSKEHAVRFLSDQKEMKAIIDEANVLLLCKAEAPNFAESEHNPYAELKRVLNQAFDSQTKGKAKERHNQTGMLPFEQQRIMTISETIGSPHGLTYQVTKKMLEALDMADVEKTIHELQGAMVYLGALILFVERAELRKKQADAAL